MAKTNFTPRQLEAQHLYKRKFTPIARPVLLFLLVAWAAFIFYSYYARTRLGTASDSLLNSIMVGALLVAIVGGTGVFWAHKRAVNAVRNAGLLDESRATVRRTATTFAGEDLAFERPNNRWGDLCFVLGLVAVAALLGWFALFLAAHIAEIILAALLFAFFFAYALSTVTTLNQPIISLDERGVFASYRNFWPRLVRWHEIESAHFTRWNNFQDGADIYTIKLKNADGKTLLTLDAATFLDAPLDFQARFVAELKRRLTGEIAT